MYLFSVVESNICVSDNIYFWDPCSIPEYLRLCAAIAKAWCIMFSGVPRILLNAISQKMTWGNILKFGKKKKRWSEDISYPKCQRSTTLWHYSSHQHTPQLRNSNLTGVWRYTCNAAILVPYATLNVHIYFREKCCTFHSTSFTWQLITWQIK